MSLKQKLPTKWEEREALRTKGQFWTPDWVADAMISYAVAGGIQEVFDPAVGAGAFFLAAKRVACQTGFAVRLSGTEIDPAALLAAREWGLTDQDIANIQIRDFVLNPPDISLAATVANPPYIRHHRLSSAVKAQLKSLCQRITGFTIDGRAGLHIYFLLNALAMLRDDGRLAFIMPADTAEGVFAQKLWHWITRHYCLDAVVAFAPEATPFPGVDTNALIFFIRKAQPGTSFHWVRCLTKDSDELKDWVLSAFTLKHHSTLDIQTRTVEEALRTGLSRPANIAPASAHPLVNYANIMRGIATGSNAFFFLTRQQAENLQIPSTFLKPALGRTRDVPGDTITQQTVEDAHTAGRPTLLLSLDGRALEAFPACIQSYLAQGVEQGLPDLALIKQRKPWYKMEVRTAPPFLFAYLGRRNARFIRNEAKIFPLTSFLCVYPRYQDTHYIEALWNVLSHPATIKNLALVGKSYGAGAIKVEPRALEMLPLPEAVVQATGLDRYCQLG